MLTKNKSLIVVIAAVPVLAVLRFFQLLLSVDYTTGFYYADSGFLGLSCYLVFAVAAVAVLVLSLLGKRNFEGFFTVRITTLSPTALLICGVMFLIAGAAAFVTLFSQLTAQVKEVPQLVLSIVSIVAHLAIGFIFLANKSQKLSQGMIMLALSAYYTVLAVVFFMRHLIIAIVSEHVITIMFYVFAVLFFLACGRVFSRNETKFSRFKANLFGLCAVMTGLPEILSKYVMYLIGPTDVKDAMAVPDINMLAESLLILAVLGIITYTSKKPLKNAENSEEKIQEAPENEATSSGDES